MPAVDAASVGARAEPKTRRLRHLVVTTAVAVVAALALPGTAGAAAPRSGGRTRQGNDMFTAIGTPDVAVVDGFLQHNIGGLGGIGVTLHTHFEIHPGGGEAANPHPTIRALCPQ